MEAGLPSFGCIDGFRSLAEDFSEETVCPVHLIFEEGTVVFKNTKAFGSSFVPPFPLLSTRPLFQAIVFRLSFFFHTRRLAGKNWRPVRDRRK